MNEESDGTSLEKADCRDHWLWGILGISAAVRIIYLYCFIESPVYRLYRADHQFYREWGKEIAAGRLTPGHVFEQGPLYAYFLGGFYRLFGTNDLWLFVVQIALGVLTVWLVYQIARLVFDIGTARLAALLCGLYGPMIFYETFVMKTSLTPFLNALVLWSLLKFHKTQGNRSWLLLSALCVGVLVLIRENYILLLAVLCVASWLMSSSTHLKKLGGALAPVIVVICVTLPATIHNYAVSQSLVWVTAGGGEVLYMAWGPEATGYYKPPSFIRPDPIFEHEDFRLEASRRLKEPVDFQESSGYWTRVAIVEAVQNPLRSFKLGISKLLILFNDFEVPDSAHFAAYSQSLFPLPYLLTFGWIVGFGLVGFIAPIEDRYSHWCLRAIIGVTVLSILITYNFARFRLGMMPLWMVMTASGFMIVIRKLKADSRVKQTTALAVLILAVGISLLSFLPPPGYLQGGYGEMEREVEEMIQSRKRSLELLEEYESQHASYSSLPYSEQLEYVKRLSATQNFERSQKVLEELLRQHPDDVTLLLELGVLLARQSRYEEAKQFLARALKKAPEDADLWANLGNVYFQQSLQGVLDSSTRQSYLRQAEHAYRRGLDLDHNHPTCQQGLLLARKSISATPTSK